MINGLQPIRGGIPIAFPVFGTRPGVALPEHGFARFVLAQRDGCCDRSFLICSPDFYSTAQWQWNGIIEENRDFLEVSFVLVPEAIPQELRAVWPALFRLDYRVILRGKDKLETKLAVQNVGEAPFDFQVLLGNHFVVNELYLEAKVKGLLGWAF